MKPAAEAAGLLMRLRDVVGEEDGGLRESRPAWVI
jgi:hypothetical protein